MAAEIEAICLFTRIDGKIYFYVLTDSRTMARNSDVPLRKLYSMGNWNLQVDFRDFSSSHM